eukprot:XP_017947528.1 PREDICTED: G2 and S phase-expressed protein 1 isoform X2 [Xenopus tropicalis]
MRERLPFTLLADEEFDFDISLSPTSSKEGNEDCDDEVFVGPVRHKEKCVRASIQSGESDKGSPSLLSEDVSWSPLSGDKFVEIFKEAHLVALQLECFASDDQKEVQSSKNDTNQLVEKFVQESKSKLNIFENLDNSKTPVALKRETYCVQDSPFTQLPPSVQQRLAVSGRDGEVRSALNNTNHTSPMKMPIPTKGLSVSPLVLKSKVVQAKSTVPVANSKKTVSRLQPIKATSLATKTNLLTIEKSKCSRKLSPSRKKHLSSAGSSEDIFSDKSSVASDVSDSSFNSSIAGQIKRTLPAPGKIGLKKTQFKAPTSGAKFRKNTSSSSSSHSSMNASLNSSVSASPPPGNAKLNTSLNVSMNALKLKSNQSRLGLVNPSGASTSSVKMNVSELSKSRLKPSSMVKSLTVGNCNKSSSVSVAVPKTPVGKIQRQTSAPNLNRIPAPNKPESALKGSSCTKPQAKVMPTPTSRLKLPQRATGVSSPDRSVLKTLQPTRLMSCGDIGSGIAESTPMRSTQGTVTSIAPVTKSVSATPSTKHISSLPTPLSRRTAAPMTPRTIPRSIASQRTVQALQSSTKSIKKPLVNGPEESKGKGAKITSSPGSPIEEDLALANVIPCSLKFSPESKVISVNEKETSKSICSSNKEMLLVDFEELKHETDAKLRKHSSAGSDGYPLIDLSNTPELNKIVFPIKPAIIGQLIDLSSPLIQLSPVLNKENIEFDSPLLKF